MGCSCTKQLKEELNNTYNIATEENQIIDNNQNPEENKFDLNNNNDINNINTKNSDILKSNQKLNKEINNELNQYLPELNEKTNNNNNNTTPFTQIACDKITKEELDNFLSSNPPLDLEDNINIELRPPNFLNNDIIYYGEWDTKNNYRHGRGIQVWPNGEKYEGYWKQGHSNGKDI